MKDYIKNNNGEKALMASYTRKLKSLKQDYKSFYLSNRFGNTHILKIGSEANPPLFLLHGSNGNAPVALATFPTLSQHFCVYIPDLPAQPGRSTGPKLSMKNDDYAQWIGELAQALKLPKFHLVGFSLGGLVALKVLEYRQDLVEECFLASPAYIVNNLPFKPLLKLFIPLKRYIKSQKRRDLETIVTNLFSEPDEFAYTFLDLVFQYCHLDFDPVPVISKKAALQINRPLHILAAEDDMLFPARKMEKRARALFQNLPYFEIAPQAKHVIGEAQTAKFESYIINKLSSM